MDLARDPTFRRNTRIKTMGPLGLMAFINLFK